MNKKNISDKEKTIILKIIQKKLLGKKLSYKEIYTIMDEIANERLSDILTTYFVASSFKEGYSPKELYYFTKAMVETGNKLSFKGIVADKHSIGGIPGTRTTLIVVPIIAAAGFKIPKISSRAITTPAGTADVMEAIAKVEFEKKQVEKIVNKVGGCIVWNGYLGIAPADDVIIKVEEPLAFESFDKIIISVMAKKIAAGSNHLVLDIPYGKTAKVHRLSDGEKILNKFKDLGKHFGIKMVADINKVSQPAGNGIGPILEARDALYILEQNQYRPIALENKALKLAGMLLDLCYKENGIKKDGFSEAKKILQSKSALKKFQEIVSAQGGIKNISSDQLELAKIRKKITSTKSGTIKEINNYHINTIARILGSPKDKKAGIYLLKKINDKINKNEPIVEFYSSNNYLIKEAEETIKNFPIFTIK